MAANIKNIIENVTSPITRYIGSKSWSLPGAALRASYSLFSRLVGYENGMLTREEILPHGGACYAFDQLLNPDETKEFFPYACINAFSHDCNEEKWLTPLGYILFPHSDLDVNVEGLEVHEKCFFHPETGLKILFVDTGDSLVISFGALNSGASEVEGAAARAVFRNQLQGAIWNLMGGVSAVYRRAQEFMEQVLPQLTERNVIICGQSFGGAIASFIAIENQLPCYVVNGVQLGVGLQQRLGKRKLTEAKNLVRHLTVDGDYLTDSARRLRRSLDGALGLIGIGTPGTFGRCSHIPSPYRSSCEAHVNTVGSVLFQIRGDRDTMPSSIDERDIHQILDR